MFVFDGVGETLLDQPTNFHFAPYSLLGEYIVQTLGKASSDDCANMIY